MVFVGYGVALLGAFISYLMGSFTGGVALIAVGANQNFPFGGTSILIIVGVALDTVKRIESQLQQRNYEGFLR